MDPHPYSLVMVALGAFSSLVAGATLVIALLTRAMVSDTRAAVAEMEIRLLRILTTEYVNQGACKDHHQELLKQLDLRFLARTKESHATG